MTLTTPVVDKRLAQPRFNLAREPWIPVVDQAGKTTSLSLSDLLANTHNLRDVVGDSVIETWALRLFLIAIYDDMLAPEPRAPGSDPRRVPDRLESTTVDGYLAAVEDRLWLHHPTDPFLQLRDLQYRVATNTVPTHTPKTLCPHLPSTSDAAWWVHLPDAGFTLTAAAAARGLLVRTLFSPRGNEMGPQRRRFSIGSVFGFVGSEVGQLTVVLNPTSSLHELLLANLVEDNRPGHGLRSAELSTPTLRAVKDLSRIEERLFTATVSLLIPDDSGSEVVGVLRAPRFPNANKDDAKARLLQVRLQCPHLLGRIDDKGSDRFVWFDATKEPWRELPAIQETMSYAESASVLSSDKRAFDVVAPAETLGLTFRGTAQQPMINGWSSSSISDDYFGDPDLTYGVASLLTPGKDPGFLEAVASCMAQYLRIIAAPDHDPETGALLRRARQRVPDTAALQEILSEFWKRAQTRVDVLLSHEQVPTDGGALPFDWATAVVADARSMADHALDAAISSDPSRVLDLEQVRRWLHNALRKLRDDHAITPTRSGAR